MEGNTVAMSIGNEIYIYGTTTNINNMREPNDQFKIPNPESAVSVYGP